MGKGRVTTMEELVKLWKGYREIESWDNYGAEKRKKRQQRSAASPPFKTLNSGLHRSQQIAHAAQEKEKKPRQSTLSAC